MNRYKFIKIRGHSLIRQIVSMTFVFFLIMLPVFILLSYEISYTYTNKYNINSPFLFALLLILMFVPFVGLIVFFVLLKNNREYVSRIEITDNEVTLIYKKRGITGAKYIIPKTDIRKFKVELKIDVIKDLEVMTIKKYTMYVAIETTKKLFRFSFQNWPSNAKALLINLIKYSGYIPKFRYIISGSFNLLHPEIKDEFEYVSIHGKKMPLIQRMSYVWKRYTTRQKIMVSLLVIAVAFNFFIFFIFFCSNIF